MTAASGNGVNSQYQYDGDGNRVAQNVLAGTYDYFNDTASALPVVLNEVGRDGNIDYLYGLSMISETSSGFQYFYLSDGIGSIASLTDAAGALKASYSYDPWGKLLVPIDPLGTKNKYKFAGQELDPGTTSYFLRARYYDSATGRLDSRDLVLGGIFRPLSLNRYLYALSNPMRYIDPSGNDPWDAFWNWCSTFNDTCAGVAESTQKAEQYNACTLNIGSSSDGCNNGFPQSYSKSATNVVSTGVNVTIGVETSPETYGLPNPTPWFLQVGSFLKDLFTPKTAYAATPVPQTDTPIQPATGSVTNPMTANAGQVPTEK